MQTSKSIPDLFHFLKGAVGTIEAFYRKQCDVLQHKCETEFRRHEIQYVDLEQVWQQVDFREVETALGYLIATRGALQQLLWFGKVNRDAFLRILHKIERADVQPPTECIDFRSLIRGASFASQKRCLADLARLIRVLTRFQIYLNHYTLGQRSLSLGQNPAVCESSKSLRPLHLVISKDDLSELAKLLKLSKLSTPNSGHDSTIFDLLDHAIRQGAERCASYLFGQTSPHCHGFDAQVGNLLHYIATREGRMHGSPIKASELLGHGTLNAHTDGDKGEITQQSLLVQKLSSKQPFMLQEKDAFGRLPLHYAAEYGQSELCLTFSKHMSWPDSVCSSDADAITPLYLAVTSLSTLTTKILLEPGAQMLYPRSNQIPGKVLDSCLAIAAKLGALEIVQLLIDRGANFSHQDASGATTLYSAARDGSKELVEVLLNGMYKISITINLTELIHKWSPLIIACIQGHLPIVKLLLQAGADPGLRDTSGWTAKEHAVFRGHMRIAQLLPTSGSSSNEPSIQTTPGSHGRLLKSTADIMTRHNSQGNSRVQTADMSGESRVILFLGPLDTRKNVKTVDLSPIAFQQAYASRTGLGYRLQITAIGAHGPSHLFDLPVLSDLTNEPMLFTTSDPTKVKLEFKLHQMVDYEGENLGDSELAGHGVALLNNLHDALGSRHESLYRDCTIPLVDIKTLAHTGNVAFSFIVVTPFWPRPQRSLTIKQGFWKQDGRTQVVGHRGSGANTAAKTNLQIGENTKQSFLTASRLGATCVEFDVQLTKDFQAVIFHDFLIMVTGGNVPLHTLTFDQFMHLGKLQNSRGDISGMAETRYWEKMKGQESEQRRPRSLSLNDHDDSRSKDLANRMRYTEEGLHDDIKGNLRGHSIHEPASTLEQLLTDLPESIAFNLEISESTFDRFGLRLADSVQNIPCYGKRKIAT